jgi:hypothetical protein
MPNLPPPVTPKPVLAGSAEARQPVDEAELQRLQQSGSGVDQLRHKHPILGTIATIGDAALGSFFPRVASMVPGTSLHHNVLVNQAEGRVAGDVGEQAKEATSKETVARANLADAQTAAAGQPKPKEEKWNPFPGFSDTDGTPLIHEENSGQLVRATDHKAPIGIKPIKPEGFATREITRVVNGVPHTVMVDAQTGADVKDEGQTKVPGESSADKRSAQEQAQVEREARVSIRKAEGQYRDTQKSVGQLKAAIDASKDGNGLLTSFAPTMEVLGINAANGVHRISPAEAQAANLPGGWSERFNAWFDKATTGKMSPQLQAEGKQLADILAKSAHDRYKATYQDESSIVEGYGGKDFGKRVPMIAEEGGGASSGPPAGATHTAMGSDQQMHYTNAQGQDLGVVPSVR